MTSSPAARWGLVVFALGVLMLLGVFGLSYGLFSSVADKLAAGENAAVGSLPPVGDFLAANATKLGFLLVMGYISSLIAGKGLSLYGASRGDKRE
jgi:hypothetical protein